MIYCVTKQLTRFHLLLFRDVVVVITPPLSRDGGTARTAIQVHAVNLTEIGWEKDGSPFPTSHE